MILTVSLSQLLIVIGTHLISFFIFGSNHLSVSNSSLNQQSKILLVPSYSITNTLDNSIQFSVTNSLIIEYLRSTTKLERTEINLKPIANTHTVHIVQPNETLGQIAHHYGINVDIIIKLNKLRDPNFIFINQKLKIPIDFTAELMKQTKAKVSNELVEGLPQTVHFPLSCQKPPDIYRKTTINGHVINSRTLWMLQLANQIYQGRGNPFHVTQGSYTNSMDASFGTHEGGGVVDISIRTREDYNELLSIDEADKLVLALRNAGFAAWLRLPNDITPAVAIHIHAVAIGDIELSQEAQEQLTGPEGYFRGFNGVPPHHGDPKLDRHRGPVICDWMIEAGYQDLR